MKVGIVVPYFWSFWGGVVEHADHQARALRKLGIETRTVIGYDPPKWKSRFLHPRTARAGSPPLDVVAIGRSVGVPTNGSFANAVLSPQSFFRLRQTLERESFDLLHLHEPAMPIPCIASLVLAETPLVGTFHASGQVPLLSLAKPLFGFLLDRLDYRIAVSEQARQTAQRFFPGSYEIVPNGVLIPPRATATGRRAHVVFIGRHDRRKGLSVLLDGWRSVHRATGARLRIVGADPLAVRLLLRRSRLPSDGIDLLGCLDEARLTEELLTAKALVAPSLGNESFGMVLTRAFACATPVVASDIDGYRAIVTEETGVLVPPGQSDTLADAIISLLAREQQRQQLGEAARSIAEKLYSWDRVASRLAAIYAELFDTGASREEAAA
jgi:phosphatidylinositol alpha-mannosyltransferase